jgi:hypothetical protein
MEAPEWRAWANRADGASLWRSVADAIHDHLEALGT